MIELTQAFSQTYAEARDKFLAGAAAAGLKVDSRAHPLKGVDGEDLAIDVAYDGPANPQNLLLVSSGCHGVEGYCGSGVQVFALNDAEWREKAKAQGVGVLYIHALNPYGFSFCSRTTQENVDLNRNFSDYSKPLPINEAYREVHPFLVPDTWPPAPENIAATQAYLLARGEKAFQAAVSGGQREFASGLFYGGTAPTWSNTTVRSVLRQYGAGVKRLAWIDLHTGLGPNGLGERIFACADDAAAFTRAVAWWSGGQNGNASTPVTSIYNGTSSSAFLTGLMWSAAYEEMPSAEYTGIAMEYGTVPILDVMNALRGDAWLRQHPEAPPEKAAAIRRATRDAFYTDTDLWKGQIISQGRQAMFQAVDGLAG